jgi:hypothetical protein
VWGEGYVGGAVRMRRYVQCPTYIWRGYWVTTGTLQYLMDQFTSVLHALRALWRFRTSKAGTSLVEASELSTRPFAWWHIYK